MTFYHSSYLPSFDVTFYAQWVSRTDDYDGKDGYSVVVQIDKYSEAIARGAEGDKYSCGANRCWVYVMDECIAIRMVIDGIAIMYYPNIDYSIDPCY